MIIGLHCWLTLAILSSHLYLHGTWALRPYIKMATLTSKTVGIQPIRIVSYNVLSSHLASPNHFTSCDPIHLDANNRLVKILTKLESELSDSLTTIFCLQEVSHDWAGALHTFFANRQYQLITALYGKKFNGYMGIALAYPISLETVSVELCRLSDKRIDGWPRPPLPPDLEKQSSWMVSRVPERVYQTTSSLIQRAWKILPFVSRQEPVQTSDPWEHSEDRQNMIITVGLRIKDHQNASQSKTFWVSNYHMPCAYYAPMVMNMHLEMAAKRVQVLAGSDPYILAGDWNIQPTSPHYQLATTAVLSKDDPSYPTPRFGVEWKSTISPMRSAYAVIHGKEPDFTNYAKTKDAQTAFIETLDYIFLSKHWDVKKVKELPHRNDVSDGPYPNAEQPSDHLMIAADLVLMND